MMTRTCLTFAWGVASVSSSSSLASKCLFHKVTTSSWPQSLRLLGLLSSCALLIHPTKMASCTAPPASALWASALSLLPGASSSNSQKSSLRFTPQRTWPSQISGRRASVSAEYRRGGGGDFVAGFVLGGVVFGALGYVLAPQITKSLERAQTEKEDELSSKLEDDDSLETTRRNLNERIAQLSAQIDDVSAQVKNDGFANINNSVELESA